MNHPGELPPPVGAVTRDQDARVAADGARQIEQDVPDNMAGRYGWFVDARVTHLARSFSE
jgi:hypothetical protein